MTPKKSCFEVGVVYEMIKIESWEKKDFDQKQK